jgi:hypothetical protein
LHFLSCIGHHFKVTGISGVHFACELFFSEIKEFNCLRVVMQPVRQRQQMD